MSAPPERTTGGSDQPHDPCAMCGHRHDIHEGAYAGGCRICGCWGFHALPPGTVIVPEAVLTAAQAVADDPAHMASVQRLRAALAAMDNKA